MATSVDYAEKEPQANVIANGPLDEGIATASDDRVRRLSAIPGFAEVTDAAIAGTETEKNMSILEGFKLYPKATGWSIILSMAIVMEGYEIILLNNLFGFPSFVERFGTYDAASASYQLAPSWQAGLSCGANVGEIFGLFITGVVADRFGYRYTLIGALILVTAFVFLLFFASNLPTLLMGEILCGIPWGVFQTLTTTYAAEVTPVPLRPLLTTYVNLCWVFGQLIASGVLRSFVERTDDMAWRIPYALQWMWPIPIIVGVFLAPESPWWLVRKGDIEGAKHSLFRLTSAKRNSSFNIDDTVAMMIHTNELEQELTRGTSYLDCFKGVNLRRTEITCVTWAIQSLCGAVLMGYSAYFYELAGLATENAFDLTMAQFALGAIGTTGSWFLMIPCGRRTLYVWGLFTLFILVLTIGILGIPAQTSSLSWAIGSLLLIFTFTYDLTIGPVCYSLVAEMPSTRLRQKTIVLARSFFNFWGMINYIWTPYMLNPTAWNWGAKTGFFWAGFCFCLFVWAFFRLPEPKGRTYGELDILFESKVSARNFAKTDATQFRGETIRLPSVSESVEWKEQSGHKEVAV